MESRNIRQVKVTYAVCYNPHNSFCTRDFIVEKEFDTLQEAKDWICGYGYKIYVKAAIVGTNGKLEPAYWGRSKQSAISKLKKGEKYEGKKPLCLFLENGYYFPYGSDDMEIIDGIIAPLMAFGIKNPNFIKKKNKVGFHQSEIEWVFSHIINKCGHRICWLQDF